MFQKIWALCDLAMSLLMSKSTTFELKDFPTEPNISLMFFTPHEDPNFSNVMTNYLPAELVPILKNVVTDTRAKIS